MIKLVLMLYLFIAGNCFKPSRLRKTQRAANIVESRLAMDDCYKEDGAVEERYRGRTTTTNSGRTCQKWASQSPHKHSQTPEKYPNFDLTSNYCRNVDGDDNGPWCFTTDSSKRWETCGIPKCSVGGSAAIKLNKDNRTNCHGAEVPWCYTTDSEKRWEYCGIPKCSAGGPRCGTKNLVDVRHYGLASASSSFLSQGSDAFSGPEREWISGYGMPQFVRYKHKHKAVVCKITFLPGKGKNVGHYCPSYYKTSRPNSPNYKPTHCVYNCPKNIRIEGSHDGSLFILIKRVEGLPTCREDQPIAITLQNTVGYLHYRIVVESVPGLLHDNFVILRDVRMFAQTTDLPEATNVQCRQEDNVKYSDHVLMKPIYQPSIEMCQAWCISEHPQCAGFTYKKHNKEETGGRCDLKTRMDTKAVNQPDYLSGVCEDYYKCRECEFTWKSQPAWYSWGCYSYKLAEPKYSDNYSESAGGHIFYSEFDYNLPLAKISFTSENDDDEAWTRAPKTFDIVGRHDCYHWSGHWDTLREVTNAGFTSGGQTKSWNIPCESQKPYSCYGIRALAPMESRWNYFSLTNIQMTNSEHFKSVYCPIEENVKYDKHDLRMVNVLDVQACQQICINEYPQCAGFTFNKVERNCYLKTQMDSKSHQELIKADYQSGVCEDYYKCGEYKYDCGHNNDKWDDYFSCGEYKYELADPIQSKWMMINDDQHFAYFSKFDYNLTLAKISFTSTERWNLAPKTFDIVGSHDGPLGPWDTLKEVFDAKWWRGDQTKSWKFPCESQKLYQFYGIKSSKSFSLANFQITKARCGTINLVDRYGDAIGSMGAYEAFAGPDRKWISDPSRGMPQYISFKFKDKQVVCKITFRPGKERDEGIPYNCPKAIRIEGSNDHLSFNPIKRVEELPTCSEEGQIFEINLLNKVAYRYYRIVVESVPGLLRDEFVILRDIKMFAVADGYTEGTDGYSYRIHSERMTWDKAQDVCAKEDALLAMEKTDATHRYIMQAYHDYHNMWLGVTDKAKEGVFFYGDGTPVQKTYWKKGEPNNNSSINVNGEHCVEKLHGTGQWNDQSCYHDNSFLCQKPTAKCGNAEMRRLVKAGYSGVPGSYSHMHKHLHLGYYRVSKKEHVALAFKPQTANPWYDWYPAKVWYHFDYTFALAKISFTSSNGPKFDAFPKSFDIVGSHDCSDWKILKSVRNAGFTRGGQTKSWNISCESQKPYECFGIDALEPKNGKWNVVSLTNIQMSGFVPVKVMESLKQTLTPTTATTTTTTTTTTTPAIASENNPVSIAFVPTEFFIYKTKGKTWSEARQACQGKGGDLASLATNKEIDSIWPFFPEDNTMSCNRSTSTGGYWIGGVRQTVAGSPSSSEEDWLWLTGEPIPTIQVIDGIIGGDCAAYYKLKGHSKALISNDKCNEKRPGYICQFQSNLLQFIPN